jgi:hypothetical protein
MCFDPISPIYVNIETAQTLIGCMMPKGNPLAPTTDLCDKLQLTAEELEATRNEIKIDEPMTYDPNFRLNSTTNGWRIFAEDDSMHEIPAQ